MLLVKVLFYALTFGALIGSLVADWPTHSACYRWRYKTSPVQTTNQYGESKEVQKTVSRPIVAQAIMMSPNVKLARRNTPTNKTLIMKSGAGVCRWYNSVSDPVACLWDGTGTGKLDSDVAPGWVNNYINAPHSKKPVDAFVADGCAFYAENANVTQDAGCPNIFVSEAVGAISNFLLDCTRCFIK
ncbi:hypothetical protein O181_043253 [Austropuccinia psidii MF-1]|uniref:Secreted protein n=1 Tax=Austropuccinia psidii MF-1 TaxID=1389203 RepID=A0A9Q3DKY9_9BASI|nr:hypothetical protein [Austropuccinia psidii MF-1]